MIPPVHKILCNTIYGITILIHNVQTYKNRDPTVPNTPRWHVIAQESVEKGLLEPLNSDKIKVDEFTLQTFLGSK